ncbi:hypothetical protein RND71_013845 [Anisodus tanguticus]|uniref:Uncharacterized protein n=1 Tax=Anisodus tanguticus TaxID=243964 RepID=A0AAE1VN56_9SOLA|nr:hypothetical protein RND71_013845 [Anisodus tanguticus]
MLSRAVVVMNQLDKNSSKSRDAMVFGSGLPLLLSSLYAQLRLRRVTKIQSSSSHLSTGFYLPPMVLVLYVLQSCISGPDRESQRLVFDWLTSCGVSGEDPSLEVSLFFFTTAFLDPERSSRARVFLIFSTTLLPHSDALVEDLVPFEDEDPKAGVDVDDL